MKLMAKVLVLYYSSYGHIEQMADAVADGARAGAEVDIRRVAETAPAAVVQAAGFKTDTAHPVLADPNELANYDAIVVGTPTRFGRMSSQMASFWDTAGGVWAQGKLNGKVGAAFASTASQHGGQETTLFSVLTNLLHFEHDDCRTRLWLRRPDGRR
jgi:NAD(P)H dehydrogenase (quinone)